MIPWKLTSIIAFSARRGRTDHLFARGRRIRIVAGFLVYFELSDDQFRQRNHGLPAGVVEGSAGIFRPLDRDVVDALPRMRGRVLRLPKPTKTFLKLLSLEQVHPPINWY